MSITLQDHVRNLVSRYGGIRAASKALSIDKGYLCRLLSGEKSKPSLHTLYLLGLEEKEVTYNVVI